MTTNSSSAVAVLETPQTTKFQFSAIGIEEDIESEISRHQSRKQQKKYRRLKLLRKIDAKRFVSEQNIPSELLITAFKTREDFLPYRRKIFTKKNDKEVTGEKLSRFHALLRGVKDSGMAKAIFKSAQNGSLRHLAYCRWEKIAEREAQRTLTLWFDIQKMPDEGDKALSIIHYKKEMRKVIDNCPPGPVWFTALRFLTKAYQQK